MAICISPQFIFPRHKGLIPIPRRSSSCSQSQYLFRFCRPDRRKWFLEEQGLLRLPFIYLFVCCFFFPAVKIRSNSCYLSPWSDAGRTQAQHHCPAISDQDKTVLVLFQTTYKLHSFVLKGSLCHYVIFRTTNISFSKLLDRLQSASPFLNLYPIKNSSAHMCCSVD